MNLSERLFMLRKGEHLTQMETAEKVGIPFRTYRRYEAGEREPGVSSLILMADYYHTSIDYLVGRTDRREPLK